MSIGDFDWTDEEKKKIKDLIYDETPKHQTLLHIHFPEELGLDTIFVRGDVPSKGQKMYIRCLAEPLPRDVKDQRLHYGRFRYYIVKSVSFSIYTPKDDRESYLYPPQYAAEVILKPARFRFQNFLRKIGFYRARYLIWSRIKDFFSREK